MSSKRIAPIIILVLLSGCSYATLNRPAIESGGVNPFDATRFCHEQCKYSIAFAHPPQPTFINPAWSLDNFAYDEATRQWVRKEGKEYYGYRIIDRNDDGTAEKERAFFFDLKLVHKQSAGVIWVQSFEILEKHAQKPLDLLLGNYADSLAGTGAYLEANVYAQIDVKERKYASIVRNTTAGKLGPYAALAAEIEVVDTDQQKVNPDHSGMMLKVVLAKVVCWKEKEQADSFKGEIVPITKLLLIGYHNSAAYFDQYLPDFESFLGTIDLWNQGIDPASIPAYLLPQEPPPPPPPPPEPPAPPVPVPEQPDAPVTTPETPLEV
jgi:hypothetical protein